MNPSRILLVDDHQIIREGLRLLVEREPDLCVVGEADNGRDACELVRRAAPHVLLMDVGMPDMNGVEATRRIHAEFPAVRILALTMHANRQYLQEMLRAGASGYLLKDCASEELVTAIRVVLDGQTYLSPQIAGAIVEDWVGREPGPHLLSSLTQREREVLQMLAEGHVARVIGERIGVSTKTVDTHRKHIMTKLGAQSVAELTRIAIREGLTRLEI